MTLCDDICVKDQTMIEVYRDILYQYLLWQYVQEHVHDDEQIHERIPRKWKLFFYILYERFSVLLEHLYDDD